VSWLHDHPAIAQLAPLWAATILLTAAAGTAVTATIGNPAFSVFVMVLAVSAVAVSILQTAIGRTYHFLWITTLVCALVSMLMTFGTNYYSPILAVFYPSEIAENPDLGLATSMLWIMIAWSFALTSETAFIFPIVPGLSVFGLIGAINLNPGFIIAFLFFFFAAIFILAYDNLLRREAALGAVVRETLETLRSRVHNITVLSGLVFTLVCAPAFLTGLALYSISPDLYSIAMRRPGGLSWYYRSLMNYTGFMERFDVGMGPIRLRAIPVMRVKCNRPGLWRGQVYDAYDGRGWSKSRSTRRWRIEPDLGGVFRIVPPDAGSYGIARRERVQQRYELLSALPGVLPCLSSPIEVHQHDIQSLILTDSGTLMLRALLPPGYQYTVVSAVPRAVPEELRSSSGNFPEEILQRYTALPNSAWRAKRIADTVASGKSTEYDKVLALQEYIVSTCSYTLTAPPVPRGEDVVIYFLEKSHRGACDLFASALAVLCRTQGIPARVATGFMSEGPPKPEGYLVRMSDAHAWTEVYFPGHGWVPFNPPAGPAGPGGSLMAMLRYGQWGRVIARFAKRVFFGIVIIGGGIWLVISFINLRPIVRLLRRRKRTLFIPASNRRLQLIAAYDRLCRLLARKGYARALDETPSELADAVAQAPGRLAACEGELRVLTDIFNRTKYGGIWPTTDVIETFQAGLRRVERVLRGR